MDIKRQTKLLATSVAGSHFFRTLASKVHRQKTIFLAYHGVAPDKEQLEAWTLVSETIFRQQMEYLKNNFDCITIDEALNRRGQGQEKPGVVVTFDDGYANNIDIALPILVEFDIPAVIYVTTNPILDRQLFWPDMIWMAVKRSNLTSIDLEEIDDSLGIYYPKGMGEQWQTVVLRILEDIKKTNPKQRMEIVEAIVNKLKISPDADHFEIDVENNIFTPLTQEQILKLSSHPNITIGAHSHCHNLLDQIPIKQAEKSIKTSKKILEDITESRIDHFAFPNGNFNSLLLRLIRDIGFKSAVTFRQGFYKDGNDVYKINRFGIGADLSISTFSAMLTGIFMISTTTLSS